MCVCVCERERERERERDYKCVLTHATTVVSRNYFFVCKMEMSVKCFLNFCVGVALFALTTTLRCIHTRTKFPFIRCGPRSPCCAVSLFFIL